MPDEVPHFQKARRALRPDLLPAPPTKRPPDLQTNLAQKVGAQVMLERILPPYRPPHGEGEAPAFALGALFLAALATLSFYGGAVNRQWALHALGVALVAVFGTACMAAARAYNAGQIRRANYISGYNETVKLATRLLDSSARPELGETETNLNKAVDALKAGSAPPPSQWFWTIGVGVSTPIGGGD